MEEGRECTDSDRDVTMPRNPLRCVGDSSGGILCTALSFLMVRVCPIIVIDRSKEDNRWLLDSRFSLLNAWLCFQAISMSL